MNREPANPAKRDWMFWITWIAVLVPVPYGISRLLWAVGIPFGIDGEALGEDFHAPGWGSLYILLLVLLTEGTALYTHAFLLARVSRVPGWIPLLAGRRVRSRLVIAPLLAPIVVLASFNHWSLQYISNGFAMPPEVAEDMPPWSFWGQVAVFWIWGLSLTVATFAYWRATRSAQPARRPRGDGPRDRRGVHSVVVVGGGFGGLQAVRALRGAPVDVTLVDRRNFHLFQPLLYQVATGALSAGEIATPLRAILKRQRNARVVLGEVCGFDLDRRRVLLRRTAGDNESGALGYDTLVVAAGAGHAYFGHQEWRAFAPGLKTLEDAVEIRARILAAFEAAEVETDPDRRRAWLTFVVVGSGPTGVELAGQIAEIARDTLRREFRSIDPRAARIVLVEAADRVLTAFPERLSARALRSLERLGVTPVLNRAVVDLDPESVTLEAPDGGREWIPARTVVWAAGVRASGLAAQLADATGACLDGVGRVAVGPDLTLPGRPEVFVLGDMARVHDEHGRPRPLPGVAPAAMQQGRYAARVIRARFSGTRRPPFRYVDKGNVATVGRLRAVLDLRGLQLSGPLAWLGYLLVHLVYLVGLQNRLLVVIRWAVSFATHGRGARLITGARAELEPARATSTAPAPARAA